MLRGSAVDTGYVGAMMKVLGVPDDDLVGCWGRRAASAAAATTTRALRGVRYGYVRGAAYGRGTFRGC